jgi:hypothetical protein
LKRAAYLGHDAAPLFEFLSSLPQILALVFKALKPGGLHFASYKGGGAEGRDRYGRYFNYLSREDVTEAYRRSGPWEVVSVTEYLGGGYDGQQGPWVAVTLRRPGSACRSPREAQMATGEDV